jgi:single-strand DNA-binding protein
MARTLNRVQLIGRLGADPELRYTTAGVPVATLSLATNRQWTAKDGSLQEETEWHTIVAWDKLAQICAEHLAKGRLIYVEGRIHTRSWESNGQKQYKTEIVAADMLILDPRPAQLESDGDLAVAASPPSSVANGRRASVATRTSAVAAEDTTDPDDIPF